MSVRALCTSCNIIILFVIRIHTMPKIKTTKYARIILWSRHIIHCASMYRLSRSHYVKTYRVLYVFNPKTVGGDCEYIVRRCSGQEWQSKDCRVCRQNISCRVVFNRFITVTGLWYCWKRFGKIIIVVLNFQIFYEARNNTLHFRRTVDNYLFYSSMSSGRVCLITISI